MMIENVPRDQVLVTTMTENVPTDPALEDMMTDIWREDSMR
jgi:hypothetical protein